jgi:hypothetical protein
MKREESTFCEQKVAKKRCYVGSGMFERHWPSVTKVFCGAFFQKSDRLLKS